MGHGAERAFGPGTLDADAHQVLISPIPIFLRMIFLTAPSPQTSFSFFHRPATRRNVVDEIARCHSDQLLAFFFPEIYDLPFRRKSPHSWHSPYTRVLRGFHGSSLFEAE